MSKLTKGKQETLRIHPRDARRIDVSNEEIVNVVSRHGQVQVPAEITKATNPGTVFMTFHFPESRTNLMVSSAMDEYTGCPEYKVNAVRIEKVDQQGKLAATEGCKRSTD